jgi:hypothetical protein
METKVCSKCNEEKNLCEFHKSGKGFRSECKSCRKIIKKMYYEGNRPKILEKKKKYYYEKKDIILIKVMTYHYNHTEKIKKYKQKYYQNNKNKFNDYYITKYHSDISYKIGKLLRRRVYDYITNKNIKITKTLDIVGCTPEFLKEYLENKFTEGMSWDLMGKYIHIDHIIPLSSAKTEEEIYKLCHYTNLQPLWAEDNLRKSNKII